VRQALLQVQRQLAATGPCVAEGRDIGTVVLPSAPIKLFMTASPEVRARRRFDELRARGLSPAQAEKPGRSEEEELKETLRELSERDRRDETRAAAPTRQADDAIRFDTSELSFDEVIDQVEALCRSRLGPIGDHETNSPAQSSDKAEPAEAQKA
jgi:cytidylate kinase